MARLSDVLVVNAGSTSLKLSVVDPAEHSTSIASLDDAPSVSAVGHRIVHGGDRFMEPTRVDDEVERELRRLVELAPLHMRPALDALENARDVLPDAAHIAVFDTAFHRTIPARAATYALPPEWRDRGIRRYGFHGLSVAWSAEQVPVPRLVVCHLGGGCSVTAVRDGESVDTPMGFTPIEGVPMGTRPGSVDPGALLYLLRHGVDSDQLETGLEHDSGLRGLAGTSDVAELLASTEPSARLALDVFTYRIAQAVASMAAALGGIDAVAFTGGIGEHAAPVRESIVEQLRFHGNFDVRVVEAR
ncbi:MAG: acetate/propionate family kinase, partial [Gaiellaceae bacterium]